MGPAYGTCVRTAFTVMLLALCAARAQPPTPAGVCDCNTFQNVRTRTRCVDSAEGELRDAMACRNETSETECHKGKRAGQWGGYVAPGTCKWTPVAAPARPPGAPGTRNNVLLMIVDDLDNVWRTRDLPGGHHIYTPNMDRLQKRSTWFSEAHAQVAVCAASRLSFLTGEQ